MKPEEAATILQSLVDGRDPSSGKELPPDTVCQRATVIRALLIGNAAIESLLARQKRRACLPARVGSTWTGEEDEKLRSGFQAGRGIEVLALSHERTPKSIQGRLEMLGLTPPGQRATFLRSPPPGVQMKRSPRYKRVRGTKHDRDRDSDSRDPVAKEE
jgi:hypothetical protein